MNHTHPEIPGASPDASIVLRQILASLIAGVTTEVRQTDISSEISVSVIPMDTGLKFSFMLPSAAAVASSLTADIEMSDVSISPVQNRVIKAYVDGKFWTGTEAEYTAEAETLADTLCFLSDMNVLMYNEVSYSLGAHVHGALTNEGAIGTLADMVIMTGVDGVLGAASVETLKELLGASAGFNLLHNSDFRALYNTRGLTIYSATGECLDRWDLNGAGTLTINTDHVSLAQDTVNTAKLKQVLPNGSYERLFGQALTLSAILDGAATVYAATGTITGAATEVISLALVNGYTAKLHVNNVTKTVYLEITGGSSVAAVDIERLKLELGTSDSISDGVTDASLDWSNIRLYDVTGEIRVAVVNYVQFDVATALTTEQKAQARSNIGAPAVADVTPEAIGAARESIMFTATLLATGWVSSQYTITNEAITDTSVIEVLPALDITSVQSDALVDVNLQDGGQADGTMTLKTFKDVPLIDIPIRIIVRGDL